MGFALLAFSVFASTPSQGQVAPVTSDVILGKPDAPVTIIEYASFTCPHCAAFYAETFPLIKRDYIDSGKVKLIFRDFPLDQYALRASMLARCSGAERYYGFVEVLFSQQLSWTRAPDPVRALAQIAKLGGIGEAEFNACLSNNQIEESVLKSRLQGVQEFGIDSTPSFLINGKLQSGALPYSQFETLIKAALSSTADQTTGKAETAQAPAGASGTNWTWFAGAGVGVVLVAGGIAWWLRRNAG